ncbi:ESPR-type extended signal peptide-containing protein [Paraburkholderia sediminicola]|uniref:ESPR-type extended signal peptide-containing protein n=1 Tax=Paraburkholderia sediminicola TaxID=458836 RepID=UPI0038BB47DD
MNKSRYRLVWNRRLGALVAAAQTQRGVQGEAGQAEMGQGGSPLKSEVALAVLTALTLSAGYAHADNLAVGGEVGGTTATIGGATAPSASTGGTNPAVAGDANNTSQNTAVGINVTANGGAATALGDTVTASSQNATAVGANSVASGARAVAFGGGSSAANGDSTAIGALG